MWVLSSISSASNTIQISCQSLKIVADLLFDMLLPGKQCLPLQSWLTQEYTWNFSNALSNNLIIITLVEFQWADNFSTSAILFMVLTHISASAELITISFTMFLSHCITVFYIL